MNEGHDNLPVMNIHVGHDFWTTWRGLHVRVHMITRTLPFQCGTRGPEAQRRRGTEAKMHSRIVAQAQRHSDAVAQMHGGTGAQRHRDTETQRHMGPEAERI